MIQRRQQMKSLTIGNMNSFPNVSLLITHYNRSNSLRNLLESFSLLNCVFGRIVISDDGSNKEHSEHISTLQKKYGFDLICTQRNSGLGNNINKGQDAI